MFLSLLCLVNSSVKGSDVFIRTFHAAAACHSILVLFLLHLTQRKRQRYFDTSSFLSRSKHAWEQAHPSCPQLTCAPASDFLLKLMEA